MCADWAFTHKGIAPKSLRGLTIQHHGRISGTVFTELLRAQTPSVSILDLMDIHPYPNAFYHKGGRLF